MIWVIQIQHHMGISSSGEITIDLVHNHKPLEVQQVHLVILDLIHIIVISLEVMELEVVRDDGIVLRMQIFGEEVEIQLVVTDEEIHMQTDIRDSDHVQLDGTCHHSENGIS